MSDQNASEKIKAMRQEIAKLESDSIAELHRQLSKARAEVARIERELSTFTGKPIAEMKARKRSPRLPGLAQDGEEYATLLTAAQTYLAKHPMGQNGKQIAQAIGKTTPAERKQIAPLINDIRHFRKTGQGVSTRYFLK